MILKYAFRNVFRLYKQTLLYALISLLVAAVLVIGIIVYSATDRAIAQLDSEFVFVATLTPLSIPYELTSRKTDFSNMTFQEVLTCFDEELCCAYNYTFAGTSFLLAGDDILFSLPEPIYEPTEELCDVWDPFGETNVLPTANLYLEPAFFTHGAKIIEGCAFSKQGYIDNIHELIVPVSVSNKHGIRVGDKITVCEGSVDGTAHNKVTYSQCKVVGIYEAPDGVETPCYVTAVYYANRYIATHGGNLKEHQVYRADYVLRSRDDFPRFVSRAKENGLDLMKFGLELNNAEYDRTLAGLNNVKNVVVIALSVISAVGGGLFCFFTVFFINGRKRERYTLRCLGMSKTSVISCFLIEIILIMALSIPSGILVGSFATDAVFDYISNETKKDVENIEKDVINIERQRYLALENALEITVSKSEGTSKTREILYCDTKKDGYSRILMIDNMNIIKVFTKADPSTSIYIDPVEVSLLVVEDLEESGIFELSNNEYSELSGYQVFVPENFLFLPETTKTLVCSYTRNKMTVLALTTVGHGGITVNEGKSALGTHYFLVAGTYKPNDICGDNTILIDLSRMKNQTPQITGYSDKYIEISKQIEK